MVPRRAHSLNPYHHVEYETDIVRFRFICPSERSALAGAPFWLQDNLTDSDMSIVLRLDDSALQPRFRRIKPRAPGAAVNRTQMEGLERSKDTL